MCVTVNPSWASASTHTSRLMAFAFALALAGARMGQVLVEGLPEAPWWAQTLSPQPSSTHPSDAIMLQGHVAKPLPFTGKYSPPPSKPARTLLALGSLIGLAHLELSFPLCRPGGVSGERHCANQL